MFIKTSTKCVHSCECKDGGCYFQIKAKRGQQGVNGVKLGQTWPNGVMQGETGSNGVKRGLTGSNGVNDGQTW